MKDDQCGESVADVVFVVGLTFFFGVGVGVLACDLFANKPPGSAHFQFHCPEPAKCGFARIEALIKQEAKPPAGATISPASGSPPSPMSVRARCATSLEVVPGDGR